MVKALHLLEKQIFSEDRNSAIFNIEKIRGHSNKVRHLELTDGRRIIVKQSHFDWAGPRFYSARRAASMLRSQSSIVAPSHIRMSGELQKPTLAYWYLSYPTLKDLWPDLQDQQRKNAVRSFGKLVRKMHAIKPGRYGLLQDEHSHKSLESFLENDLLNRLKPTMYAKWPEVIPLVDQLVSLISHISNINEEAVLVHNDLHIGNILCKTKPDGIECVGFLDLEETKGGNWISDIASASILHHPVFADTITEIDWIDGFQNFLMEGYDKVPDPLPFRFFQIYHLLNLGLFSAMNGDNYHANLVHNEMKELKNKMLAGK